MIWAVKDSMMSRDFGRIVNVSSIAAQAVRPNVLGYAAAKAGLNSLTKSCCQPLARRNVRINGIAPGVIETDLTQDLPSEFVDRLREETPLNRLGTPDEVASVISFLLSEEARYMTGTTVVVSGGRFLLP
jgi:3-oxoacyl-[acyl-carrier protein] reductase